MKNKLDVPLKENPDRLTVRIWKKDEPTLKADLIKTLIRIKHNNPKSTGICVNWAIISALKDFIKKYG